MAEKPIIFSPVMVKAILEGRKTQTRRLTNKLKYRVGDVLYVREPFVNLIHFAKIDGKLKQDSLWNRNIRTILYLADIPAWQRKQLKGKVSPAIHMPKEFSRIKLEVTNVRREHLQDISDEDLRAEGVEVMRFIEEGWASCSTDRVIRPDREIFAHYWNNLRKFRKNDKWEDNPVVWVIEFKVLKRG